ncbi:MAG: hypothetical protein WCS51_03565 [Bacilli bacterium]
MSLAKAITNRIQSDPIEIKVGDETFTYRVKKFTIAQNDEYNRLKRKVIKTAPVKQLKILEDKFSNIDKSLTETEILESMTDEQVRTMLDAQFLDSEEILKFQLENGIGRNNFDEEEFDKLTPETLNALLLDLDLATQICTEVEKFNNPFLNRPKSVK